MKLRKFIPLYKSGEFFMAFSVEDVTVVAPNDNDKNGCVIAIKGLQNPIPVGDITPGEMLCKIEKHLWDKDFSVSMEKELSNESNKPLQIQKEEAPKRRKPRKKVQKGRSAKADE